MVYLTFEVCIDFSALRRCLRSSTDLDRRRGQSRFARFILLTEKWLRGNLKDSGRYYGTTVHEPR